MDEKLARKIKNYQYRSNMVAFFIEHTKKCDGAFGVVSTPNGEKLVTICTCETCKESKTFYYNI